MWPFKKHSKESERKLAKTVLCIPGNWIDFEDFQKSLIVSSAAAYMVVGDILINGKEQRHYSIEFCNRDVQMENSFRVAGRTTGIEEDELLQLGDHRHVIYVTGETGSLREAKYIARAGLALLEAGGTGLKVESTGIAFSKIMWIDMVANLNRERDLYAMFVLESIVKDDGTVFSSGMHNLGFKDTLISNEKFEDAVSLIRTFGYYQIVENPIVKNNQTFQIGPGFPLYRITNELHPPYAEGETFYNPFGMWRLAKISQ
jgi:hypothetical protein